MFTFDPHDILMWIAIIGLVLLMARTGMYINRFFIYRAHRRAIAELHRRATKAERPEEASARPEAEAVNVRT